jgi:hypothetical protein
VIRIPLERHHPAIDAVFLFIVGAGVATALVVFGALIATAQGWAW